MSDQQSEVGQANLLQRGRYLGRAVSGGLGATSKGDPQVAVMFELGEPVPGHRVGWYGFFTPKTEEATLKALFACGWDGENIKELNGITERDVELVIELEQQVNEQGEKIENSWRNRVRWVNEIGSASMMLVHELEPAVEAQFVQAMYGRAAAMKQKLSAGKSAATPPAGAKPAATADVGEPPPWAR